MKKEKLNKKKERKIMLIIFLIIFFIMAILFINCIESLLIFMLQFDI